MTSGATLAASGRMWAGNQQSYRRQLSAEVLKLQAGTSRQVVQLLAELVARAPEQLKRFAEDERAGQ